VLTYQFHLQPPTPTIQVRNAMNEINASKRLKESAYQRAEGEKILKVRTGRLCVFLYWMCSVELRMVRTVELIVSACA
jgi:hypothetical protein